MKVLLVCKSMVIENLGVMYLSAVVKSHGHECKICEMEDAMVTVKIWKPEAVGFSVMTGDQVKMNTMAMNIKDWNQDIKVIVGGPHPTFFPQDFKDRDYIDYIVQGEGENWMSAYLLACNGSKPITPYTKLDGFPWPDRTDFKGHRIRDFISSRGCPYNCSYCYNDRWAKMFPKLPRVRTRSVDNVIAEINGVVPEPEFVYFQDSCFGVKRPWLREFSQSYRRSVNIPFHCHARPNQVDEEYVLLLHDANCMSVRIALESASQKLRELLNRGDTDLEKVARAVRLLKKWGIRVMVQNILALPTSTIEDDLETLEFNIKCQPSYAWSSIFVPYPGTELGDWCQEKGYYKGNYDNITDCFFDISVLEFTEEHKEQTYCLQKVFALCVEARMIPKLDDLTYNNFPNLVHSIMRKVGDRRLYGGII